MKNQNSVHGDTHKIAYYQLSPDDVFKTLKTSINGLSENELEPRVKIYGQNKLVVAQKEAMFLKFFKQFKDLMVIMLLVASALSVYFQDFRSAGILFLIVVINALIGFFQEYKAEKIMDSLQILVQAHAKVIRDGQEMEIQQSELVPGDIVVLEEGDSVPADLRLIEENNLATNDFALTGESNPSRKFIRAIEGDVPLGDRHNIAFMGTTVATGNAKGVVVGTGMLTEIGRIANLTQETSTELSPLQKELNNVGIKITYITLGIAAILFVIALIVHFSINQAFIFAVGVASAMVPEGLPSQVTIALSLAAGRLAKKNAVVKKLSAVETLGATHIICTDKTGTLTKNEMTVEKILIGQKTLTTSGSGYNPEGQVIDENGQYLTPDLLKQYAIFFEDGVFASNARISPPDKEHVDWYAIGDPTEAALINLGRKVGLDAEELDRKYPELLEFTFDSVRKRMSSIRNKDGEIMVYVKGSPTSVLESCTRIWDGQTVRQITAEDRDFVEQKDKQFAMEALRNLGYAYKDIPVFREGLMLEETESDLIWLGMVSMIDPPRDEVNEAMKMALKANIRVIIITGDYALTAEAIAKKVGLESPNTKEITVVNGQDLQGMSDIDLLHKLIYSNLIFARTAPEDKLRIVSLLKKAGEIVAVTGDGVNDAPALKKADIGVAMGKTGTDVAKNSAEIILLDDSFGTLVSAIREGRIIFQNIKKAIFCNMTGNSTELFTILISLLGTAFWGYPLALLTYQLLAIDLVAQMLPITFLTWDPPQPRIMSEVPRNPDEHVVNKISIFDFAWSGLVGGIIAYSNFFLEFYRHGKSPVNILDSDPVYIRATTLTYVSIVFVQWVNIMSRRAGGQESIFSSYLWSNKRLLLAFAISIFLILNIVYNPVIAVWLATGPLSAGDWSFAAAGGVIYLIIREVYKIFRRARFAKAHAIA